MSGNSIALAGNVTVDTGATAEQISLPVTLSGGTTVTVTDSTSNLTMSGVISSAGSQSLAKAGAGTLTLAGTDTYSGGTTISAGRLQLGANNALPTSGTVQMNTVAGVTLDLNNYNQSLGDLSDTAHGGADTITLGSGTLTLNGPSCDDFNGVISGTGGLVINGTVLVDGNNTYSGGTTVNSGAYFSFDYNNVMPAGGAVYIASGGQLDLYGTHQLIGNLTGSGQIISYSGGNAGQLEVCPSGSSSFAGSIQDDGTGDTVSLKVSGGTQILTGANTYTGGTVLSGGTLQLGDGTSGHDGSISNTGGITDNSSLVYDLYGGRVIPALSPAPAVWPCPAVARSRLPARAPTRADDHQRRHAPTGKWNQRPRRLARQHLRHRRQLVVGHDLFGTQAMPTALVAPVI